MTPEDRERYRAYAKALAAKEPPVSDEVAREAARIIAAATPTTTTKGTPHGPPA